MTDQEPKALRQAMAAAEETRPAPQGSPPASSEVERLIATGDRLLRVQQARLSAAYADYEQRKTERMNWYRSEMRRLVDEADHEMLLLDRAWDGDRGRIEALIAKLKALRAA